MPHVKHPAYTCVLAFGLLVWACASGIGTAPACAQAGCSSAGFAPATNITFNGGTAVAVAKGDFNGDGNTDLVSALFNSGTVAVLLGDGAGGFSRRAFLRVGGEPDSVGVGDFNGDGKSDLAVAHFFQYQTSTEGKVSVFTGAGDGTFSAHVEFPAGPIPRDLVVSDFNGDAKADVAVANIEASEIRVLLGNGAGGLGAPAVTAVGLADFSGVYSLAVGDFNRDGRSDLAGVREKKPQPPDGPGRLSVLLGDGAGGFTAGDTRVIGGNLFHNYGGSVTVAVGDLNGDAFSDLAATSHTSGTVSVLFGAGDGTFPAAQTVHTGGEPSALAIADFNRDGRNDLAVTRNLNSRGDSDFSVFIGDGAGGFSAAGSFSPGVGPFIGIGPLDVVAADFNNDGRSDLAAGYFFGDLAVLINNCGSPAPQMSFQFEELAYSGGENDFPLFGAVFVRVTRTGLISTPASVDYSTVDGTASERSDYTTALGTLNFEEGQTLSGFFVLVSQDSLVEGRERFTVALSNPTGGAALGAPSTATVDIFDDDTGVPTPNVIDDAETFVNQHYSDFLNRPADSLGLDFWKGEIDKCGGDLGCIDAKRTHVSQAFFLSIEFQRTGYQVIRVYRASFGDSAQHPRGLPRYREFLHDTQELQHGVVVGGLDWEQQLLLNTLDFALRWVTGAEFVAHFPADMTAQQFVDKLFANSGVMPTATERDAAIAAYGVGGTAGRAAALLSVTDSGSVYNRQFNSAAVLMQYFGYLRRNPSDAPEPTQDFAGYDFWLAKLDSFSLPGEDVRSEETARNRLLRAEMVRAFILSGEYRKRFGQ
ncbi:MAG TPA: FG-GAP-like repeat-containing protein [Pyrinomonadaceae bacterium]|jgi:hypothetical protein